jgi:hypothetical protein
MLGWWLLSAATEARADQCAWIEPEIAQASVKYLTPGATYALLCEPCGDKAPVAKVVGSAPTVASTSSPPLVEVSVDGQPIDLAYVFVRAKPGDASLTNLAKLAKCPTTGVSKSIPAPAGH